MLEREERPPHPERWIWECFERIWCHRCAAKNQAFLKQGFHMLLWLSGKTRKAICWFPCSFTPLFASYTKNPEVPKVRVFHPSCCGSLLMQRHRGTHVTEERNHTNLDGSAFDCISDELIIFDQFDLAEWAARLGIYLRNSLRVQTTTVQNY